MGKIARKVKHVDATLVIASILVTALISVMIIIFSTDSAREVQRLTTEVQRVTDVSAIQPVSVSCRNSNIADICYVTYSLSDHDVSKMLDAAGYGGGHKVPSPYPYPDSTVFENKKQSVRVTVQGDTNDKTATLRYVDIDVRI